MIKVKNLKFKYSGTNFFAINNVSFEIPHGKYISIIGHNGSGKSTLSKLLVGLYKPVAGTIIIDGIEIQRKTLNKIHKKIGIVFQNPDNQFIGATVEDDIAFGLENKNIPQNLMYKIIFNNAKKVGMEDFLEKEPQNLSGGQKQRVAIASVLALDPEIIIFDEITSMLDPKGKKEIYALLKEIKKDGKKTLISITHDMEEALLSDIVIVMAEGKIIAMDKPSKIFTMKEIIKKAKIDTPFVYKIAKELFNKKIFTEKKLVEEICKLK